MVAMLSTLSRSAALASIFLLLGSSAFVGQNASQTKQKEPLAVVAGQSITDDDLLPYVQAQLFQFRLQEYDVKSKALENLVNQKLLEAQAKKKGIATDKVLEQEVDAKVPEPTEAELQALYIVQKQQLGKPFEEIKGQLAQLLKQAKVQQARQDYYKRLREQAGVSILLQKPKVEVAYDPARLRGDPKAPLVILEFSDFQCPYCLSVEPTLKNLLVKYEGQVSLAYRDLPLRDIHPQAQLAAEAGRCAEEQGKFWEYHDLLFANQNKLNREGLVEQARTLKLDGKQFDSCLSSGKYKPQIEQDLQLGLRAGINGTPGFIINGNLLTGNLPQDSFEKLIQAELASSSKDRDKRTAP
jgi:protein-disulfide isomerase